MIRSRLFFSLAKAQRKDNFISCFVCALARNFYLFGRGFAALGLSVVPFFALSPNQKLARL